ncbi:MULTISPECIES: N-acetylglucosamine-6-phosphate deacetylase [unclassified Clostridioides]|uniref:N-acetylglucosamine-6-phosphate deacetylase n=1 Tax=unclassified Clostridioides TaxID=2635829 RepID=UPI001D12D85D|nr:N-acetylglucosamine-6-phosphate deacetylase [Clostridioides sp. ES-S-0049-03]MCC0677644.1 N-acetylglucosamine-6-phosphate deacetylase [Clostridioides sp. ES-W-0018-02]MCC0712400.1 N-acetylglucosamine-6-phosphate deacetylase [Clostridioides sp. ES-W-0017-02]
MKNFIYADKFFMKYGIKEKGYLRIIDGKFGEFQQEKPDIADSVIDFSGKYIAPGLVDTHIHGLLGVDIMDNTFEAINTISKGLLKYGVTSFLPTTLTDSIDNLNDCIENISNNYDKVEGAKIQGIYLEGPFFTEKYKGAQNEKYFRDPSIDTLKLWQKKSKNLIRKIAIAPERNGSIEFTKYATKNNISVALGHSSATFEQVEQVVNSGAKVFVHTYNGMSPLNHREPGMVGAVMALKGTYAELICDGHHVNPVAAKIIMDIKSRNNIALITDCMRAGAMDDGEYTLGRFSVNVKNGVARLSSGSLAGSVLTMDNAVRNIVDWNISTLEDAIKMATYIPALSCNIDNVCGSMCQGMSADFIVIDDNFNIHETYVNGICKYKTDK